MSGRVVRSRLIGLGLVLVALLGAWIWGWNVGRRGERGTGQATAAKAFLAQQGAQAGQIRKPSLPGTPAGAEPVFRLTSSSEYGVDRRKAAGEVQSSAAGSIPSGTVVPSGEGGEGRSSPAASEPAAEQLPWPSKEDLRCDVDCHAWWVEDEPWGRAIWTASLQGPHGGDLFSRTGIGKDQKLELAPRFTPTRWRFDFLAGLSGGAGAAGAEVGLAWTGKKNGGYALVEYVTQVSRDRPADRRIHAGWRRNLH
jgi:hypothetical protein